MVITFSKPHLVCTLYDKQINAKKYDWKFGSVQIILLGDYTKYILFTVHRVDFR